MMHHWRGTLPQTLVQDEIDDTKKMKHMVNQETSVYIFPEQLRPQTGQGATICDHK